MATKKKRDPEDGEDEPVDVTIKLGKDELSSINLLRAEGETALDVIKRALQDSLEYGVMKQMLASIDGRIAELSNKYKTTQASIINFRYDIGEGVRGPEEMRSKDSQQQKVTELKTALEKKWVELEQKEKKVRH